MVKITKNDHVIIGDDDIVTVTEMGHLVEIQHMEKMNNKANIRKIDNDRYIDIQTGEIKEFEKSFNRSDNHNSLRQTMKKLRYLINNNFTGANNELHITLTYKENMKDEKKLYVDVNKFMKRLRYSFKGVTTIDYINVVEPQERGAWHVHALMRFNDKEKIFIENKELASIWGHGFVNIKSLKEVDNIGAYLSAYLADVELTNDNTFDALDKGLKVIEKDVSGEKKKFIKGGRLHMYPLGMNIFRKSRGCKYPERKTMTYKNAKKIVGSAKSNFEKSYNIQTDDFENNISYVSYNLMRN